LPTSMEPIPNMSEDDHIKELLRFTSEEELIKLGEIGLYGRDAPSGAKILHGRTDVPYTEETAAKLQAARLFPGKAQLYEIMYEKLVLPDLRAVRAVEQSVRVRRHRIICINEEL
jgi:hypothetical protein